VPLLVATLRAAHRRHLASRLGGACLALLVAFVPAGAAAETGPLPDEIPASEMATVKVINFTADWCPNCEVLNPRLDEAISRFEPGEIALVNLDVTASKSDVPEERQAAFRAATARAEAHGVAYLWDWYGGLTGLAVFVSGDNGEPLSCANRSLSTDEIERRMREALVLSLRAPAGARKPNGPDCPPPLR